MEIVRNYLNYIGSKDRSMSQILENLDYSKDVLVDIFCGSATVTANAVGKFKSAIVNDGCWQLMRLHQYILDNDIDKILLDIDNEISKYNLSKINKDGFYLARNFYNQYANTPQTFHPPLFFVLIMHGFNYSIHLNSKGGFSVPFGTNRSSFNKSLRNKLIKFKEATNRKTIVVCSQMFNKFIYMLSEAYLGDLTPCTFYADPPYLASDDSYSRIYGLKWNEESEITLYNTLDMINQSDATFLLSNALENNGKVNKYLEKWSKKYNIVEVKNDFENCNYQRFNKKKTIEILVRNY